jgi:hypothetical protein
MTISEKTKRSPYLKGSDKKEAVENTANNPFVAIIALLLIAFIIGLLVLGNIWVWGSIF